MRTLFALLILLAISSRPFAQVSPVASPTPEAVLKDVKTVDGIVAALYDVISGPAGKKRDWDRMRSLFAPDAQMSVVGPARSGAIGRRALSVEGYIQASAPILEERGFFEREAARRTEQFGNIAHVFSTYESRHKADDAKPFQRGINSIQLWNDGTRWWIQTVMWQAEDAKNPLPPKYGGS